MILYLTIYLWRFFLLVMCSIIVILVSIGVVPKMILDLEVWFDRNQWKDFFNVDSDWWRNNISKR